MSRVLYKLDASPPACSVMILADMLGIQFEKKDVDWRGMEHKLPEYLKLNPMGTIPVLIDGDFILSESHAINNYLLSKYGTEDQQKALYPTDIKTRAIIDQLLHFNTGVFFVRLKVVALPTLLHGLQGPSVKHLEDIENAYNTVEEYLQGKEYIACNHITLADISLGTTAAAMQGILKIDDKKFPLTASWLFRLHEEPSFQKYIVPCVKIFTQTMKYFWEKNKQS